MLELTAIDDTPRLLDFSGVSPDRLAERGGKIRVVADNRRVPLAELFHVSGDPSDGHVRFVGGCTNARRVGAGMKSGTLEMIGDVGDDAGVGMCGGRLIVRGSAGDRLGGLEPGGRAGMTGGTITVYGNCGRFAGHAQRRGLIAVTGNCGDFAGTAMIAGTIVVGGTLGRYPGAGMKRGTIMALGPAPELLPTFAGACEYEPAFLQLLTGHCHSLGIALPQVRRVRLYRGDRVALGLGEILIPSHDGPSPCSP